MAQAISDALEAAEPALDAVTLFEDGAGAWRIEAYAQSRADARSRRRRRCGPRSGRPIANVALEDLPDLNWVAISQAALPPVIAGRFVVHGSHDRGRIPYGPRAIVVDAGEAFGTAHHATTLGCLLAIDKLARAAAISPRARPRLRLGRAGHRGGALHARRAGHRHRFRSASPWRSHAPTPTPTAPAASPPPARSASTIRGCGMPRPFDLIIANILAGPLRTLAGDVSQVAAPRRQSSCCRASSTRRPRR